MEEEGKGRMGRRGEGIRKKGMEREDRSRENGEEEEKKKKREWR